MYLVLSLPSGQAKLSSFSKEIIKDFHAMVVNDAAKALILDFLEKRNPRTSPRPTRSDCRSSSKT